MHQSFIRPWLNYVDIILDQIFNLLFHQKHESIQCNACLVVTEAIRCTSRDKPYQKLRLKSLQYRRWLRKLFCFCQIYKNKQPYYLFNLIPTIISSYCTSNRNYILHLKLEVFFFEDSFFHAQLTFSICDVSMNTVQFNLDTIATNAECYRAYKTLL